MAVLFESAIQLVVDARRGQTPGSAADLREIQPTFSSMKRLDFSSGETTRALIFSGPVTAFRSLEAFVACGIDAILLELGFDHRLSADMDDAAEELALLRFEPVNDIRLRSLGDYVFSSDLKHDLSYYDHPGVRRVASMHPWIFPASGGQVLTSRDVYFLHYWYSTG